MPLSSLSEQTNSKRSHSNRHANDSYDHFMRTGRAKLMVPNESKSSQRIFSESPTIGFFKPLSELSDPQRSYEHFKKTGHAELVPSFPVVKVDPPRIDQPTAHHLSSNFQNLLTDSTKSLGKKLIVKELDYAIKGLGAYYVAPKLNFMSGAIKFESERQRSLQGGNSETAALVCSLANVGVSMTTRSVGYAGLGTAATGATFTTGALGVASTIAFWGTGVALVESSSEIAGNLAQRACHAAFKMAESSDLPSPPRYRHY